MTPKYRAWIKDSKTMGKVTYMDYSYEGPTIGEIIEVGVSRNPEFSYEDPYGTYSPDSVILMAFTGMYDTLGEELYEYDIVLASTRHSPYFKKVIIFWDERKASFRTIGLDAPYNYDTQKMYTLQSPLLAGNIFQTPQLATNLLPIENSPYVLLPEDAEHKVRTWVNYIKDWNNRIGIFELHPNGPESTEQAGCNRSSSTDIGIDVEKSASGDGKIHMEENSASGNRGLDGEGKDSSVNTAEETAPVPTEKKIYEELISEVKRNLKLITLETRLKKQYRSLAEDEVFSLLEPVLKELTEARDDTWEEKILSILTKEIDTKQTIISNNDFVSSHPEELERRLVREKLDVCESLRELLVSGETKPPGWLDRVELTAKTSDYQDKYEMGWVADTYKINTLLFECVDEIKKLRAVLEGLRSAASAHETVPSEVVFALLDSISPGDGKEK